MASTLQIREAAARRRRAAYAGAAAVVVGLAAVGAAVWGGGAGSGSPAPSASVSSAVAVPSSGWLVLPPAGGLVEGRWPVRFPRSPQGAVAALAASLSSTWTPDTDQARRAAAVYAAPGRLERAQRDAVRSAQQLRSGLGVRGEDPIPAEAYVTVVPVGARWQEADADHVTVALLIRVTAGVSADASPQVLDLPVGLVMVWDGRVRGGDWVATSDAPASFVPAPADAGTYEFTAAGWVTVAQQGRP